MRVARFVQNVLVQRFLLALYWPYVRVIRAYLSFFLPSVAVWRCVRYANHHYGDYGEDNSKGLLNSSETINHKSSVVCRTSSAVFLQLATAFDAHSSKSLHTSSQFNWLHRRLAKLKPRQLRIQWTYINLQICTQDVPDTDQSINQSINQSVDIYQFANLYARRAW